MKMVRSRPLVLLLVVCAMVAAGCGSSSDPPASSATSPSSVVTDLPPAADLPEGRGAVTAYRDGTRAVTSAWGTVEVPAEPKRIVSVLGYIDLESMLALGIKPLAAGTQGGTLSSGFAPHLVGLSEGIQPLAWADGAPAEAIAALRPDLIFAPDKDSADLLAGIAPTVPAGAANGAEWKDDFRYVASVLGREDDAERLLKEYEDAAQKLKDRISPVTTGRTVASAQVAFDHTQVYVDLPDAFSSVVLTELGLTMAPIVADATGDRIAVSFERLPEIDADIVFWQVRQKDEDGQRDTAGFQVAQDSPLWPQIRAVQSGNVHQVDNRPWYFPTIVAARRMLADVESALLG